jgi:hypothetical protein
VDMRLISFGYRGYEDMRVLDKDESVMMGVLASLTG